MKFQLLSVTLCCCTLAGSPALAQEGKTPETQAVPKTVNAMCPIGMEPVVESAGTFDYKGNAIGTCCPGCAEEFLAWDEPRKDEFVVLAMAHKEPGMDGHGGDTAKNAVMQEAGDAAAEPSTGPFTLGTCPVSGNDLRSMGDSIVKVYGGREVRFCCAMCIEDFEGDQSGYFKKIGEQIIADQLAYYPTQVCVVSGDPLIEDGEDISETVIYGNRMVRLCCKMCRRAFKEDPTQYIAKLDEAAMDAQRADYPVNTCVVGGDELGSMGEVVEMVVAGRLVRLCCAMCVPEVEADPATYLAAIDAAWQVNGRFMPLDDDDGHDGDDGHGG